MSALDIALGEAVHEVRVTRSGERATVWIDGVATAVAASADGEAMTFELEGRRETVWCVVDRDTVFLHAFGRSWKLEVSDPAEQSGQTNRHADAAVAPMPGVVVSITAVPGAEVKRGEVLAVIESMKMHSEILAPRDGRVERVLVSKGETFAQGAPLVTLEKETEQ